MFCCCRLTAQSDTLSVLSWNVFLRPAILPDGQAERVDSISQFILDKECDIVVLQEVFHRKSRRILLRNLGESYTHHTKFGKTSFWGIPSGILILSRYPIKKRRFKYFKKATGSDALARKAVVKSRISINSVLVDVYGTHMQAGSGIKRNKIRQSQLNSIQDFINDKDSIVDIIAGDFNISAANPNIDSILVKLNTELPIISGKNRKTANFSDHKLMESEGKPKWIDFIFLRKTKRAKILETTILEAKYKIEENGIRFSDHNAIVSKILLY